MPSRSASKSGMSTSFLVIQAQRDLAQAKTNELSAVLAHDLALVDFESLQQAGPTGQASGDAAPAAGRRRDAVGATRKVRPRSHQAAFLSGIRPRYVALSARRKCSS